MSDDLLRELANELPWDRPDAARRDRVRSSLLVEASLSEPTATSTTSRRRVTLAGLAFAAGAMAAAAIALVVVRDDDPDPISPFAAEITASAEAQLERTTFTTSTGLDEVVQVHTGTVRVSVDHMRSGDHVRAVTADAEVEGTGVYEVHVVARSLDAVRVTSGTAAIKVRGQHTVVLAAGQTWRAPIITTDLSPSPSTRDRRQDTLPLDTHPRVTNRSAVGNVATATGGSAVGSVSTNTGVGGAVGNVATATGGSAVGSVTTKTGAGAVGNVTTKTGAGAVGNVTTKTGAGAVGSVTTKTGAGAVGSMTTKAGAGAVGSMTTRSTGSVTAKTGSGVGSVSTNVGGGSAVGNVATATGGSAVGSMTTPSSGSVTANTGGSGAGNVTTPSTGGAVGNTKSGAAAAAGNLTTTTGSAPGKVTTTTTADAVTGAVTKTASPNAPTTKVDAATSGERRDRDAVRRQLERRFQAGWRLLKAGKARDAARELGAAADEAPEEGLAADARYWQAVALVRAGQSREAERVLLAFLDHAPTSLRRGRASLLLGRLIAARGDVASARAWLQSVLDDPDRETALAARKALDALPVAGAGAGTR
ncbi:MAG TPA: tetratricopeptide repeat protein [Kofleriaceae bacterium]|nr:tetratricopeptide repeat protein [Kofleriaceae bacterium]